MNNKGSGLSRKLLDKAEQPAAFSSRVDAQLHEVLFCHVSAHAQEERLFWTQDIWLRKCKAVLRIGTRTSD